MISNFLIFFGQSLSKLIPIQQYQISLNLFTIECFPSHLFFILIFLKKHSMFQFSILQAMTGIDFYIQTPRFQIFYELYRDKWDLNPYLSNDKKI